MWFAVVSLLALLAAFALGYLVGWRAAVALLTVTWAIVLWVLLSSSTIDKHYLTNDMTVGEGAVLLSMVALPGLILATVSGTAVRRRRHPDARQRPLGRRRGSN